jgi:translation initiation factor 1
MAKKIPVSAPQQPLQSPFSALSVSGLPEGHAAPEREPGLPPSKKGRVVLRREKSGRGGKTVIVISDFATHIHPVEIEALAVRARKACGCGGAARGREVELQGDNAAKVRAFLEAEGFRVAGVA